MMQKSISEYIILIIISALSLPCMAQAQKKTVDTSGASQVKQEVKKALKPEDEAKPLIQGLSVYTDLVGVGNKLFGGSYLYGEVGAELNLLNRFMPVIEAGYATCDVLDDDKSIAYKTSAPYFRVGMNYNFMHKKDTYSIIYAGLRYGFTSFSFDISSPALQDPIWGGEVPFDHKGISCNAGWLELVAGIRAQIWKNLHMGWSVRYKRLMSTKDNIYSDPHYIPGYGVKDDVLFGFTYNIIYYLPLNKK